MVLIEVKAIGGSFPDLLLSKGMYQLKPEPPFTLGVDAAGVVKSAPPDSGLAVGDRVATCAGYGAAAEVMAAGVDSVFKLPDNVTFEQAAAIPMNYMTAEFVLELFALSWRRGANITNNIKTTVELRQPVRPRMTFEKPEERGRAAGACLHLQVVLKDPPSTHKWVDYR